MATAAKDAIELWQDYGIDKARRRVMFHYGMEPGADGAIGVDHVIRNLLWLDSTDGAIELWLNCPGGAGEQMWALHDVIRQARNPVIPIGFGIVCSAACLILACGTGTRYVTRNTYFMWHQGWVDAYDGLSHRDAQDRAEFAKREFEHWCEAMARYTRKPTKYWRAKSNGELWLDSAGIIEHGIADELVAERT